ncbi:hypothetical protein [Falsiroseomonas sp.]|uniref:hypothetical protein n=1 Tax=Falsiroseomonas sp. TaxID=2870721 RepID=UPI003569DAEB
MDAAHLWGAPLSGRATQGGVRFQDRVAAVAAVRMLAGESLPASWAPSGSGAVATVSLETLDTVDDVVVRLAGERRCLVNAKANLALGADPGSPFGKALGQFLARTAELGFDPGRDRLVLATTPGASISVRTHFKAICARARDGALRTWDELATTDAEKSALDIVRRRVRAARGCGPADDWAPTYALLSALSVAVLGVDDGEAEAEGAIQALRQCVPQDRAALAWRTICDEMVRLAADRSGVDREGLRRVLRAHDVPLLDAPDLLPDIAQLRQCSERARRALAGNAVLPPAASGGRPVEIPRRVSDEIAAAAEGGNLLVVGEPGAGKTGALLQAARRIEAGGRPVLVLQADSPDVARLRDGPDASGARHPLGEVLQGIGGAPGVLFLDALDAARGDGAARAAADLMRIVRDEARGWTVVASVRRFDLRHDRTWQRGFRGDPPSPSFADPEFSMVRHVAVPRLDEGEIAAACATGPLREALAAACPATRELLRSPFHLRLVAELLAAGVAPGEAVRATSRSGLLAEHWAERVTGRGPDSIAREAVLGACARLMVERRSLRCPKLALAADHPGALAALLSDGVLTEDPVSGDVSFPHHILFDHAMARLVLSLGTDPEAFRAALAGPALLTLAPAAGIAVASAWEAGAGDGRNAYWQAALGLASSGDAALACAVVSREAAARAARGADLERLGDALRRWPGGPRREAAMRLARHLVQSLSAGTTPAAPDDPADDAWAWLALRLLEECDPGELQLPRVLMHVLAERLAIPTAAQAAWAEAARRCLAKTMLLENPGKAEIWTFAEAVIRTAPADRGGAEEALLPLLNAERLQRRGEIDLGGFAHQAGRLARELPGLYARAVTAAMLAPKPGKDEPTDMSGSHILPLTSNRRQDFESSIWQLLQRFDSFAAGNPADASRVAVEVTDATAKGDRPPRWTLSLHAFGKDRTIHALPHYHSEVEDLLTAWRRGLATRLGRGLDEDTLAALGAAAAGTSSVLWVALLELCADHPEGLHEHLTEALVPEVLGDFRLGTAADKLLGALHKSGTAEQRQRLERQLLAGEAGRWALRRLPTEKLTTEEARTVVLAALPSPKWPARPEPDEPVVAPGPEPASPLRRALEAARSAIDEHSGGTGNSATDAAVRKAMADLRTALGEAPSHDAATPEGWAVIARTCRRALEACWQDGTPVAEPPSDYRDMVLEVAAVAPFDANEAWDDAKAEAGYSLLLLIRHGRARDAELEAAVLRLSDNPSHEARRRMVSVANLACRADPELAWRLVEQCVAREEDVATLAAASAALSRFHGQDPARAAAFYAAALRPEVAGEEGEEPNNPAIAATALYVATGHPDARRVLTEALSQDGSRTRTAAACLGWLRGPISVRRSERLPEAGTERARALFALITTSTCDVIEEWLRGDAIGSAASDPVRQAVRVADIAARELLFASRARDDGMGSEEDVYDATARRGFLTWAGPLLHRLGAVPHPAVTHHVIQTLASFHDLDPGAAVAEVLSVALGGGAQGGYQLESLAVDLVVDVVRRALASGVVQGDPGLQDQVRRTLELFAAAGWPKAYDLAVQLPYLLR